MRDPVIISATTLGEENDLYTTIILLWGGVGKCEIECDVIFFTANMIFYENR